jgi:hypothetical protein
MIRRNCIVPNIFRIGWLRFARRSGICHRQIRRYAYRRTWPTSCSLGKIPMEVDCRTRLLLPLSKWLSSCLHAFPKVHSGYPTPLRGCEGVDLRRVQRSSVNSLSVLADTLPSRQNIFPDCTTISLVTLLSFHHSPPFSNLHTVLFALVRIARSHRCLLACAPRHHAKSTHFQQAAQWSRTIPPHSISSTPLSFAVHSLRKAHVVQPTRAHFRF